jgi:hypothetical protein
MTRRAGRLSVLCLSTVFVVFAIGATAQTIEGRQWQGTTAVTRQPEQVVAQSHAEWRSLWSRVGATPPDVFEPGRMTAIGIFLGMRGGSGYSVNVISTNRRRDRIIVVFEERAPAEVMMAQRAAPTTRPMAGGPMAGGSNLAPGGSSNFASPGTLGNLTPPPAAPAGRPSGPATSPWTILLINRADLPVSVEQRWFR